MSLFMSLETYPVLFFSVVLMLGLLVGSFLNVVIHRLPLMLERQWKAECADYLSTDNLSGDHASLPQESESPRFNLMVPRSRCPQCGHSITALENIPVLSYLLLRGKCRECGTGISAQYPLVEALTGVLSIIVAWHFGFSWQAVAALGLTWSLIALSVIDLKTTLLPDSITLPVLWVGLLISLGAVFTDPRSSIIGAVAGYLALWSVYQVFKLITGKEGMGYGDFKLLALLGAWMGWKMLPLIVLLSSFVGALIGIAMIVFMGRDRSVPIPFGPYLAIAGWIALLWGDEITQSYVAGFAG